MSVLTLLSLALVARAAEPKDGAQAQAVGSAETPPVAAGTVNVTGSTVTITVGPPAAAPAEKKEEKKEDKPAPPAPPTGDVTLIVGVDGQVRADRMLPAGKEFTVVVPGADLYGGTLEIWRLGRDGQPEKAPGCDTEAPEHYCVALVKSGGGLIAHMPALTSGTEFRMALQLQAGTPGLWEAYRQTLAREVTFALLAGGPQGSSTALDCTVGHIQAVMNDKVNKLAEEYAGQTAPALQVSKEAVADRVYASIGVAKRLCEEVQTALVARDEDQKALERSRSAQLSDTVPLVATATWTPPVLVDGKYVSLNAALEMGKERAAALQDAARALEAVHGVAQVKQWSSRLERASRGLKDRDSPAIATGNPLLFVSSGACGSNAYVRWNNWANDSCQVDQGVDARLLAQVQAATGADSALSKTVSEILRAREATLTGLHQQTVLIADAQSSLYRKIVDLLDASGVPVAYFASTKIAEPAPSQLPTDKDGSYFSPAFGAGFAYARGGSEGEWWAAPYFGVDVYFNPIDRNVPFSELGDRWTRRFGVTVGMTIYSPVQDLPNRQVKGLLGDNASMLVGVTGRIGRFTNLTVYGIPFRYSPALPLEEPWPLCVAPGIAFSFDADVWATVGTKIKGLK